MDYSLQHFFPAITAIKRNIQLERNSHRFSRLGKAFCPLWIAACLFCSPASASSAILVVASGSTDVYTEVIDSFVHSLNTTCSKHSMNCVESSYDVIHLDRVNENTLRSSVQERRRLIVTIGRQAAVRITDLNPSVPILHTLIPHEVYQQLPSSKRSPSVSAIFIDQPIQRRLLLLKEAMPQRTRVGILISRSSLDIQTKITSLAKIYGLKPVFEVLEDEAQLGSVLTQLLDRSDVLLAVPDPVIFNRNTVRNILLSSYHYQIPVIGFSEAYVKAGAITAVFSTPEEIGRQAGEEIAKFLEGGGNQLPSPAYPKYYSVVCNQRVSNSLHINIPDAELLERRLREISK